jgi:4-hydroxy-tetrahydrodipicolinate synthase
VAVVSNEAPELLVELMAAAAGGERERAAALHAQLVPLMKANFCESNPIPVKWAMARLGLAEAGLRLPLLPLEERFHGLVEEALTAVGLELPEAAVTASRR